MAALLDSCETRPATADRAARDRVQCYRMHARSDGERVQFLTRTWLDWSRSLSLNHRGPAIAAGQDSLSRRRAVRPAAEDVPAISSLQAAMDEDRTDDLVFIVPGRQEHGRTAAPRASPKSGDDIIPQPAMSIRKPLLIPVTLATFLVGTAVWAITGAELLKQFNRDA